MEKIKHQVSAIVVFKGATFQELNQENNDLGARIDEGIERMKAAGVFANHEIEEIRKYAFRILQDRCNAAFASVRDSIRNNFEF